MHIPKREDHPIPFVITHWINLLSMFFLALSGFYIHFPLFGGFMGVARGTHFFFMFVLLINLVVRIIMGFFIEDTLVPATGERGKDIKNFLPQQANRHQAWPWIKYYLFLKKENPIGAKYGVLQKVAYIATVPLTLLAAWTGFCLWEPTSTWPMFAWTTNWVATWWNGAGMPGGGDPMNIRIVHYYIMWVIILFTAIHAYLANIYGFAPSKMIFFWEEIEDIEHAEHGVAAKG